MNGAGIGVTHRSPEHGATSAGLGSRRPRHVFSTADLELEFGSAIGDLELGQGMGRVATSPAIESAPTWTRLFRIFQ